MTTSPETASAKAAASRTPETSSDRRDRFTAPSSNRYIATGPSARHRRNGSIDMNLPWNGPADHPFYRPGEIGTRRERRIK